LSERGPIPFQEIKERALVVLPTLLHRWLPDGRQRGRYWLGARNPTRVDKKPGSFAVELRLGWWRDYATGDKGGDPISLYAFLRGIGQGEAAKELAGELGIDPRVPPTRWTAPKPPPAEERVKDQDREAAQRRAIARSIWRKAGPAPGTPVEAYLRHRAIALPVPASLRFAELKHRDAGRKLPCMVAAMQVGDGLVGVHRTFLAPDGQGKAKVPVLDGRGRVKAWAETKLMLGSAEGAAVRLSAISPNLCLAEGIETALSVQQLAPGWTVWAALSAGNLPRVAIPDQVRRLVIVADGDEKPDMRAELDRQRDKAMRREGLRQAQLAATALHGLGIDTSIVVPRANGDMNDVLQDDSELAEIFAGYMAGSLVAEAAAA
jgi:hypothetical protein